MVNDVNIDKDAESSSVAKWYVPSSEDSHKKTIPTLENKEFYSPVEKRSQEEISRDNVLRHKVFGRYHQSENLSADRIGLHKAIEETSLSMNFEDVWAVGKHTYATSEEVEQAVDKGIITLEEAAGSIKVNGQEELAPKIWKAFYEDDIKPAIQGQQAQIDELEIGIRDKLSGIFSTESGAVTVSSERAAELFGDKAEDVVNLANSSIENLQIELSGQRLLDSDKEYLNQPANQQEFLERYVGDKLVGEQVTQVVSGIVKDNLDKVWNGDLETRGLNLFLEEQGHDLVESCRLSSLSKSEQPEGVVVIGGAASGKSGVNQKAREETGIGTDAVEFNPDNYKKSLLAVTDANKQDHGSLTHAESSRIMDTMVAGWLDMHESGAAPNMVGDYARANNWTVGKFKDKATLEVYGAALNIETALERSYARGEQTGRFMPTPDLVLGHEDQVDSVNYVVENKLPLRQFSTNVPKGADPKLIAEYKPDDGFYIYNMEEFQQAHIDKAGLNPDGKNLQEIHNSPSRPTPQQVLEKLKEKAGRVIGPDGKEIVLGEKSLSQEQLSQQSAQDNDAERRHGLDQMYNPAKKSEGKDSLFDSVNRVSENLKTKVELPSAEDRGNAVRRAHQSQQGTKFQDRLSDKNDSQLSR